MSGSGGRAATGSAGGSAGAPGGAPLGTSAGASAGAPAGGGEEPPRGRGVAGAVGPAVGPVAARFSVQNRQRAAPVDSAGLAAFLARVAADAAPGDRRGATLRLLSDRGIRELNRQFRGTDAPTDVLAFPAESPGGPVGGEIPEGAAVGGGARLGSGPEGVGAEVAAGIGAGFAEEPYLGDLAVSAETARRQAAARGETLDRELRVLALHGYLHLLGYDHETDRGEMSRLERLLSRRHGLAPGGGVAAGGEAEAAGVGTDAAGTDAAGTDAAGAVAAGGLGPGGGAGSGRGRRGAGAS